MRFARPDPSPRSSQWNPCLGLEQLEHRLLFSKVTASGRPLGVDVSHFQGTITWSTLAAQKDFAIIKGTGSDDGDYLDSKFTTYANGARAAGVIFGTYHFADPGSTTTDAVAQADYMIAHSGIGMENGNLPPMLDLESGYNNDPTAISNWANAFCYRIYARLGVKPVIYASSGTYASYVNSSVYNTWKLVDANYGSTNGVYTDSSATVDTGNPPSTGHWSTWTMWQYNSVNHVPGIGDGTTTNVDSDVFKGTLAQLQAMEISGQAVVMNGANYIASGGGTDDSGNAIIQQYGTVGFNSTSPTMTFTIHNEGTPAISLANLMVPAGYTIVDGLNESSLPSLGTDTITVKMNTGTAGTFAGNITFNTTDPDTPIFKIPITGTVLTAPQIAVKNGSTTITNGQTSPVNFGSILQNATGPSITFTISNAGGTALTTSGLTVPSGYTVTDTLAGSIAAGGSDSLTLQLNTGTVGTFSGNVSFTDSAPSQSSFSFPITGTVTDPPPTLAGGSFNDDQSPPTVSFQFSKTIQSLSSSNLAVSNLDGGAAPSVTGYSYANNIGTFTLDSSLVDAHFRATLNGVQDLLGTALAGNNALDFSFLTADANGDGVVNAADFVVVATNFGLTGNVKFSQGDFNYDGTVNALDFNALAANFGATMLPAGSSLVTDNGPSGSQPLALQAAPTANLFSAQKIQPADPLLRPDQDAITF